MSQRGGWGTINRVVLGGKNWGSVGVRLLRLFRYVVNAWLWTQSRGVCHLTLRCRGPCGCWGCGRALRLRGSLDAENRGCPGAASVFPVKQEMGYQLTGGRGPTGVGGGRWEGIAREGRSRRGVGNR